MKSYAEYFEEGELLYRLNTLLQFGDSWDLVGNAVLANPGSAEPISGVSDDTWDSIAAFYGNFRSGEKTRRQNWYEFSPDATMRFVEKIFNGWYLGENIELNGVIQLFNTFNIKNQNLQRAVAQIGVDSELLFSYGVYKYFNEKPTYFGFGQAVLRSEVLRNVAINIFVNSSEAIRSIYEHNFFDNSFYHPMYINQAYGQGHFWRYKKEILAKIIKMPNQCP